MCSLGAIELESFSVSSAGGRICPRVGNGSEFAIVAGVEFVHCVKDEC